MLGRIAFALLWVGVAALPSSAQQSQPLTRHPIVLIHGAAGFDSLGPIDYFNDVAQSLRGMGAEVLVPSTSPIHRTAHRAALLKDQILAAYPDPAVKLNLIAHSQGGLDARFMITHLGMADRVASLSTVGTPHRGALHADLLLAGTPGVAERLAGQLLGLFGWDPGLVEDVSVRHMALFNALTPDDPRILYQSWGGQATLTGFGSPGRLTFVFYPTYVVLRATQGANDGMVPLSSTRWGVWRGVLPTDHGGLIGWGFDGWDHVRFYEGVALELALLGY
ncbi:MAG: hypothetical protein R3F62_23675 [Planctomycetota bacterium]